MSNSLTRVAAFVFPVLDDWESLRRLMREIAVTCHMPDFRLVAVVVNDGGASADPGSLMTEHWDLIRLVDLKINLGHQRAIAIGLAEALALPQADLIVVMDSDGEDRPADVMNLLRAHEDNPSEVIVAQRARRSERVGFRIMYLIYRMLFKVMTSRTIDFGNFSLIPRSTMERLVNMTELCSSLPATLLKSRLPLRAVPTIRGTRYSGQSRMNISSLVLHGLSAISVFAEVCLVRSVFFSLGLLLLLLIVATAVIYLRFFTDLAVPGWSTMVLGFLFVIAFQAVLLPITATLLVLFNRSLNTVLPADLATRFVATRQDLKANG